MYDFGDYAELIDGQTRWSGRSGRSLDTLDPSPAEAFQPLWQLAAVRGAVDYEPAGEGTDLVLVADLDRASEATGAQLARPQAFGSQDVNRVRVALTLDRAGRIARSTVSGGVTTAVLELSDFGVPLPEDWSRLPELDE